MKRLRRVAFDRSFYHCTTYENLIKITEMGMLLPNETKGAVDQELIDPSNPNERRLMPLYYGFTFWGTDFESAFKYAEVIDHGPSGLVAVIEAKLPTDALLPDDNDCPDCETWEESAEAVYEVKVLGPVTDNYFTEVTIVAYDAGDVIYTGPFHRWQRDIEDEFGTLNLKADEIGDEHYILRNFLDDLPQRVLSDPTAFLPGLNVDGNGLVVNNTLTEIRQALDNLTDRLRNEDDWLVDVYNAINAVKWNGSTLSFGSLGTNMSGAIVDGNVYVALPLISDPDAITGVGGVGFGTWRTLNQIKFYGSRDDVFKNIAPNVENVRWVFGDILNYAASTKDGYNLPLGELLDEIAMSDGTQQTASRHPRRLKRGNH